MKKYSYIFIDLDDTIFDFKKGESAALKNVMDDIGYNISNEEISMFSELNEKYFQMFSSGELTRDEFHDMRFKDFFEKLHINSDPNKSDKKYMDELSKACEWVDGAYEMIVRLHKEYKLYIASNGMYEIQLTRLKKANILNMFDGVYVSSKIGFNKPAKEFFLSAMNDIGDSDKSKYLMIGDREESDIIGGINAGIDTIYFNRKNKVPTTSPTYIVKSLDEITLNKLENM